MALIVAAIGAALAASTATARIVEINVASVKPFADGATFGAAGKYERVTGTAKGELDPGDARNKVIKNIDKAPKNAEGMVEYEVDFDLLRPADTTKGNRPSFSAAAGTEVAEALYVRFCECLRELGVTVETFNWSACTPTAVLSMPVVLLKSAWTPVAVFKSPVVLR